MSYFAMQLISNTTQKQKSRLALGWLTVMKQKRNEIRITERFLGKFIFWILSKEAKTIFRLERVGENYALQRPSYPLNYVKTLECRFNSSLMRDG